MKKRIIIFSLIVVTISLATYGFINRDTKAITETPTLSDASLTNSVKIKDKKPLEFFYFVSPRFEGIKKSDIDKAASIYDFISDEDSKQIKKLNSTELILIINDRQTAFREYGTEENLTSEQLKMLQSIDYSKHFVIKAIYENNESEYHDLSPHYTVVPENEATYTAGNKALLKYLKDNKSKDTRFIDTKKLQAVKASFTITTDGSIKNINLDRTTKYPVLDNELIELIKNIPGTWKPAQNSNGEKVDQELVLSFGLEGSC